MDESFSVACRVSKYIRSVALLLPRPVFCIRGHVRVRVGVLADDEWMTMFDINTLPYCYVSLSGIIC
jgi:hypothetical protein